MAKGRLPRAYVNDVELDTSKMKYVNDGAFDRLGIGGRPSGLPSGAASEHMDLEHVGDTSGGKKLPMPTDRSK